MQQLSQVSPHSDRTELRFPPQAVSHIHANDILHMDLKPENVFMDGPNKTVLKVGDFGNSVSVGGFDDEDGDPIYLAPEVLRGVGVPAVLTHM